MFFFKLSFEIFHGSSRISLLPQINLIAFLSALYAKFLMLTLNVLFYFMSCILINIAIFGCQFEKLKYISMIAFRSLPATIHSYENILLIASLRQCFFSLFLFFLTKLRSPSLYANDFYVTYVFFKLESSSRQTLS